MQCDSISVVIAFRYCMTHLEQAYMLLGTLETMMGNATKARRYLHFAETVHAGMYLHSHDVVM